MPDTPAPRHIELTRVENGWVICVDSRDMYVALSELHALEILTSLLVPAAPDYARDDEA